MIRTWFTVCLLLFLGTSAHGGPNAGGVLNVHDANLLLSATNGSISVCGQGSIPGACVGFDTRVDGALPGASKVWKVYAVFPIGSSPRLMGVAWGIDFALQDLAIVGWGMCGDFQLNDNGWPAPDLGSTVTWNTVQTGLIVPIYWFGGYAYNPTTFRTTENPAGGGAFGDDSVPALLDYIADYGSLGFGTDGELVCPHPLISLAKLELQPARMAVYQPCGGGFPVDLQISDVDSLAAFEVCAGYDGSFLDLESVAIDPSFLGGTGRDVYPLNPIPCDPSCEPSGVRFGAFTGGTEPPAVGSGRLARLTFRPRNAGGGADAICLEEAELSGPEIPPEPIGLLEIHGAEITHVPYCYGDFNGDGNVTSFDLAQIIPAWGCRVGDGCYVETRDINLPIRGNTCVSTPDSAIDVVDVQTVAGRWHLGCPGSSPTFDRPDSARAVRISPALESVVAYVGDTVSVALVVEETTGAGAFEAEIRYNPAILQVDSVERGSFLTGTGRTSFALGPLVDNELGRVLFGRCTVGDAPGTSGGGVLARIVFRIEQCGVTTGLQLAEAALASVDGWPEVVGELSGGSMEIICAASAPDARPLRGRPALLPNRPNPLTARTVIPFALPGSGKASVRVRLAVFDAAGRLVGTLCDGEFPPGEHAVEWDGRDQSGSDLPSGVYFCRLACQGVEVTRPISVVR